MSKFEQNQQQMLLELSAAVEAVENWTTSGGGLTTAAVDYIFWLERAIQKVEGASSSVELEELKKIILYEDEYRLLEVVQ